MTPTIVQNNALFEAHRASKGSINFAAAIRFCDAQLRQLRRGQFHQHIKIARLWLRWFFTVCFRRLP